MKNWKESISINSLVLHLIWHVGVWKSTIAKYLIEKHDFIEINGDKIWKLMCKEPNYESKEEQAEVYRRVEELIRTSLQSKKNIVLEAFGMSEQSRKTAQDIIESENWTYQQIEVIWPNENELKERILSRYNWENRDSDGDRNVYLKLKDQREDSKSDRIIIKNQWWIDDLYEEVDIIVRQKTASPNKLKLLKLEKQKSYVFHGSINKIDILEPRQAFNNWEADWKPAVFATEIIDIAIFRSLINRHRWDIIGTSESKFWIRDWKTYFSLTKNLLEQAKDKIWYIHVLDRKDFSHFEKIECKSYNSITPIEIITVTVDDLPDYTLLKSTL